MPNIVTDSFLFLFVSMVVVAASLYLPSHISTVTSRAFYYYAGDPLISEDEVNDELNCDSNNAAKYFEKTGAGSMDSLSDN